MILRLILTLTLSILVTSIDARTKEKFEIAGSVIDLGEQRDLRLQVTAGDNDPSTFIPITVINGVQKGPTVLMVAGVHGFEFAPILAAEKLANTIKPSNLAGQIIIVRVAHMPSFVSRSPFVNPYDHKNLNRSFPGDPEGTQTERIAYALSSDVIAKADIVFDVHSGDGAEWLEGFIGVYGGPLATNYPQALSLATSFGLPNIVRYKMNTQEQIDQGRSLNRQAVAQGLPTLLIEIGENGSREPEHVQTIVDGMLNSLIKLNMLNGKLKEFDHKKRYFDGTSSVKSAHTGIWHPVSASARSFKKGDKIGEVRDFNGKLVETIVSPTNGYSIYGQSGPPVRAGDSVVTIAKPIDQL